MSDSLELRRTNCVTCLRVIHIAPGPGPDHCPICQVDQHLADKIRANILFLKVHPGIREALDTGLIEGVPFTVEDGPIQPGDTYIAERNTGLKLLTCRVVNRDLGCIFAEESAYPYDIGECFKIRLLM